MVGRNRGCNLERDDTGWDVERYYARMLLGRLGTGQMTVLLLLLLLG